MHCASHLYLHCSFWRRPRNLRKTSSLSRLGTVAPWPDWRLSSRKQHGRLGMCFFVSGAPEGESATTWSLPRMWASRPLASEARLLLTQVVDRVGRIEAPPPLLAAFIDHVHVPAGGSISGLLRKRATANPFNLLGLLVIPGATTGTQVLQFDKKSGAYHIFFNHQRSTKSPSQTQKCM